MERKQRKIKVVLLMTDRQSKLMGYTCDSFTVNEFTDLERFFELIRLPRREVGIIRVNNNRQYINYVLQEGDVIELADPPVPK